jgi:FkbM family methyltransferase
MQTQHIPTILETLSGTQYRNRIKKARRFEQIEGGGVLKQIERLITVPSIYIPYVVFAKMRLSHKHLTTMSLFWGRKVQLPLDDYDALILYMYGGLYGTELKLTKFFAKNIQPNDVFYDVGANRGFYTFLALDLCKEVHTFEPMPELAEDIKKNTRPTDTLVVNAIALSDTNASVDFYIMNSSMLNTINPSVVDEILSNHKHHVAKKLVVPTVTIDAYVETHTKPTFLKIDAEGAEHQIIKGGIKFFDSYSPIIAMEVWGKDNKWELSMAAAEKLISMGYKSYRMDENGDLEEVHGDLSAIVSPVGGENLIFKK